MKNSMWLLGVLASVCLTGAGGAVAQRAGANGVGSDPDGDSNPAVNTRLIARIGDAAEAALDPPFKIITFETTSAGHGDVLTEAKIGNRTVKFSKGLKRQICDSQLYYRYDTECSYMAAPSGKFAAVYRDDYGRPLSIAFEEPVCAAALAIYPTGGREEETFEVKIRPFNADGEALDEAKYEFNWTKDTFRWRLMAGAYFLDEKAARVDVSIESKSSRSKNVRFLIDDVAFIEDNCAQAIEDINAEDGIAPAAASDTDTTASDL